MFTSRNSISVTRVELGSEQEDAVAAFINEGTSLQNETDATFAATDKSGAILGVCIARIGTSFVTLKPFLRGNGKNDAIVLKLLVKKAVKWARDEYPQLLFITEVERKDIDEYERIGFLKVDHPGSFTTRLLFPPHYSQIKELLVYCCTNDDKFIHDTINLLEKILAFKFVPLVVLHHLLDVYKLGNSIVETFVRVASHVQHVQEVIDVSVEQSKTVIKEESLLLDHAWERLNTGHFSEVDECWRRLYAAVSLVKAVRLACAGQYLHAIAAVDLGLLMGNGIPDQLLQRYAQFCDHSLPPPTPIEENKISLSVPKRLPNSVQIPVCTDLSKWEFVDQYLARSEPVIVKGLNSDWPAVKNWSFEYLHRILSHRVVPVEQGSKYTDADWAQKLMTGSEFFHTCTLPLDEKGPLYLAQHRLFNQVPQLCDDFSLPLYCDHCEFEDVDKNCWIGPGGTVSPLHTDPRENLFCQITGRKFFRMVSSSESDKVYAFRDGIITNTSQVDVLNPDLEKYPEFANAKMVALSHIAHKLCFNFILVRQMNSWSNLSGIVS
ncbi:hypothetical protein RB195_008878 [Necator americanus]|uniref:JmjC domain-containing protein 5 n=1 Tax=Necator americanus TaxID=51031 RepID=A0ABR1CSH2_NECAM